MQNKTLHHRSGLTLIELLVFVGIFALVTTGFISIFISVTRINVRQIGASEVNQQSQFLLQTIQRNVEKASLVEMETDTTTSTLTLRVEIDAEDPTTIYLSNGVIYLTKGGGSPEALTSDKVNVTDITFVRRANHPSRDSVDVSFSMEYVTLNPQQAFSRALEIAITRVTAATFDSSIVPGTSNTYQLGTAAGDWKSINNTIHFSGSNVGVGALTPGAKLQISGGDVYVDDSSKGYLLKDTSGDCWRIRITTGGTLTTATTTCP